MLSENQQNRLLVRECYKSEVEESGAAERCDHVVPSAADNTDTGPTMSPSSSSSSSRVAQTNIKHISVGRRASDTDRAAGGRQEAA